MDECFLEPEWKSPPRESKRKEPKITKNRDLEQEYYYDRKRKEHGSVSDKTFIDSMKEHKLLILAFAVIIIILVCVIVYIMTKSPIKPKKPEPDKTSESTSGRIEQYTNRRPPTDTQQTDKRPPTDTQLADMQPTDRRSLTDKQPVDKQPADTPAEQPSMPVHAQIVKTIDDDELNRYIDIAKDETDDQ